MCQLAGLLERMGGKVSIIIATLSSNVPHFCPLFPLCPQIHSSILHSLGEKQALGPKAQCRAECGTCTHPQNNLFFHSLEIEGYGSCCPVPTRWLWVINRMSILGISIILTSKYKNKPKESMGAASPVKTERGKPLLLSLCQRFYFSCEFSPLFSLIWCPLVLHVSVQLCIKHVVILLNSPAGILLPVFPRGGTTLSVTFIPLSPSFTLSTPRHVLPLPASPSSLLLPRSPTHHLLSLSLNDLIPPMPLHRNSHVSSNFSVEVTRRVWMWQC